TDIYAGKLNDFPRAFGLVEDALKNKELFGTPAAQKVLQARKKAFRFRRGAPSLKRCHKKEQKKENEGLFHGSKAN
ncbi:MAG: hypothetical protein II345_07065, partial [Alistipes sp.]|nr:hypothetical protein [Alistipes sp.]